MDTAFGSLELDTIASDLLRALVKEGIPEADAQKIVQVVLTHVADKHDDAHVTVRRRQRWHKFWISLTATVVAGSLGILAAVPLIRQLNESGFSVAASVVGAALGLVGALASFRLRSLWESAKRDVTIEINVRPLPAGESAAEFERPDFATFANAVGRVADRDSYAVG